MNVFLLKLIFTSVVLGFGILSVAIPSKETSTVANLHPNLGDKLKGYIRYCESDRPNADPNCMCAVDQCRLSQIDPTLEGGSQYRGGSSPLADARTGDYIPTTTGTVDQNELKYRERYAPYERESRGRNTPYLVTCVDGVSSDGVLHQRNQNSVDILNNNSLKAKNQNGEFNDLPLDTTPENLDVANRISTTGNYFRSQMPLLYHTYTTVGIDNEETFYRVLPNNKGSFNQYFLNEDSIYFVGNSATDGAGGPPGERFGEEHFLFYHDKASTNPNDWYLPLTSVCLVDNRTDIAYWYDYSYFLPLYYKDNTGATLGGDLSYDFTEQYNSFGGCNSPLLTNKDLFNNNVLGTNTFIGCLPNSINGMAAFVLRAVIGLVGFLLLTIITANIYVIMSDPNNPEKEKEAKKKMVQAIVISAVMLLSLTILNFIGITILDLGSFNAPLNLFG